MTRRDAVTRDSLPAWAPQAGSSPQAEARGPRREVEVQRTAAFWLARVAALEEEAAALRGGGGGGGKKGKKKGKGGA